MTDQILVNAFLWFLFGYMILHTLSYLGINLLALISVRRHLDTRAGLEKGYELSGFEPPITLIVPAYNEEQTIVSTVRSAMHLSYPEFEVVVVNDGSKDATLATLIEVFGLRPFPEAYRVQLASKPVRAIYRSPHYPNLRVVDKENGGKADAINTGINASHCPLVCVVDADSILMQDSLMRIVQPFINEPDTVASGGTVRIANGCQVKSGHLTRVGLPGNWLALFQVVEYMRAFLFGRMGWSVVNGLLIISGAFGLLRKDKVVEVGGYLHDTIGEDMELVVRLHRLLKEKKVSYHISFVPDPIVWTEAPENLRTLKNQRVRWQRGLSESLWKNRGLLFSRGGGAAGWLAFPFFILFEWLSPVVEMLGYVVTALLLYTGHVRADTALWFLLAALAFSMLLSAVALLLEEIAYRLYPRLSDLAWLYLAAFLENFGYRQLNAAWRLRGMLQWISGRRATWGVMQRRGNWQR